MRLFEPVLFLGERPVVRMERLGFDEPRRVVAAHSGHFALHERLTDGSHLLARDLLGVHKLFFAVAGDTLESSNYLIDLLRAGHPFAEVFSVPAGHLVRVQPREHRYALERWGQLRFGVESGAHASLGTFAAPIRAALERALRLLAERFAGRPVYVTLSGGLDSTTIAALAHQYFPELCTVTFALRDPREAGPGADLHFARRVARDLGLAHLELRAEPDEVLELLDDVLLYGQDYRDFNVHCGLMNAAIAKALGAMHAGGPRPVVLSGDTLNELLADYAPVHFRGREYFGLPVLEPGLMRRFLVGGLDSGDREVGIFEHFGVEAAQPYALCAREYAALPSELACASGAKARLVRAVMGQRIPEYVLTRPKVRAQVAVEGEPGGTLALLVNRGLDQAHLKERFARLFGIEARAVSSLTRAGYYRFSTSYPRPPAAGARVRTPLPKA